MSLLFYLLNLDEVLHARDHTLDDDRVVVLHAGVDLSQTESVEILALLCRSTDATFYLRNL